MRRRIFCRARRPFLGAATSATGSAAPRHTKTGRCAGRKQRDGKPVPYRKTFRCHSEERMRRRIISEPGSERFFGHFMPSHPPAGGRLRGQPPLAAALRPSGMTIGGRKSAGRETRPLRHPSVMLRMTPLLQGEAFGRGRCADRRVCGG